MTDGRLPRGRPGLVAARARKGWSQAEAAEKVGVSPLTWSRWETGDQEIRTTNRMRIANVFGVSLDEVSRWADGAASEPLPWDISGTEQPSLAATLDRTSELWRWDVEPSRRRLLASLPFVPEFLSEWLLSWQFDPALETRGHQGAGPAVGLKDVHRLREAIDTFITMDHLFGGGYVRPAIVDFLHHQVSPLMRGTYSDEVGRQLISAAAALTGMAGWEAYDLSLHGLAQGHYGQALQLAKHADNPLLSAWLLSIMAQQAIDLNRPDWAIRLSRAAHNAGQQAEAPPHASALLLLREARATALKVSLADTHDQHTALRVERLLVQVEGVFARAGADDERWWPSDLTESEIAAEAGCAWRMIGNHRRALDCAKAALAGFGNEYPRSVQFNRIHQAQALLGMNEVETAISAAHKGVPAAGTTTSARSVALVKSFDHDLEPYADDINVIEWREYLGEELRGISAP
jgi:transcriptional regulator with XRE-family HTH domain